MKGTIHADSTRYAGAPARKRIKNTALEFVFLSVTGGAGYYSLEILFRGYSHWSMAVCGGLCLLTIYRLSDKLKKRPLYVKAALGALIITAVEFVAGCIVNLTLGWNVWDYSALPFNILGQICLPFTLLWFLLCLPVCPFCSIIKKKVFCDNPMN